MDIRKTKDYYKTLREDDLCDCDYCKYYYKEIKAAYPLLAEYLEGLGVDIEKPFEAMPLEPYEGYIEYMAVQYVVMGDPSDFEETDVADVHVCIAESHPMTDIAEPHFVIELYPVTLKWTMDTDRDQKGKIQ